MKVFYGSIFMKKEKLEKEGIYHPIKIEYYKLINEENIRQKDIARYGIKVIKTEYIKNCVQTEEKEIKNMTNDENKANEILEILKENEVTPICVQDIIYDFSKKMLYL